MSDNVKPFKDMLLSPSEEDFRLAYDILNNNRYHERWYTLTQEIKRLFAENPIDNYHEFRLKQHYLSQTVTRIKVRVHD